MRSAAKLWQVNPATIVNIAAENQGERSAVAEDRPTPEALYELALAELAFGVPTLVTSPAGPRILPWTSSSGLAISGYQLFQAADFRLKNGKRAFIRIGGHG